ncbi:MAG TPA: hypothetical protein GX506_02585 [Firmicutes bacterium]|nr:hypothetical protein [Bacillota bacterium]
MTCCGHGHGEHHTRVYNCECGCHFPGHGSHRRFLSREERVERLKSYLADLKAEMQGVEKEIRRLSPEDGE